MEGRLLSMNSKLESKTIVPLYQQLMDRLKEQISSGIYKPGDQLPPELEMAKQNNVSVVTARKAVNELAAQGMVEKRQGKGTFVTKEKYGRDFTQIVSFSEACRAMGLRPGSKLLESKLASVDKDIPTSLGISETSSVLYLLRLRYVNDEPVVIESNYFSLEYAFLLDESLVDSLFTVLWEKKGVRVEKSRKRIGICRATSWEAKQLGLSKNHPLLLVRSVAYTGDDRPVYVGNQIINADRFELMV